MPSTAITAITADYATVVHMSDDLDWKVLHLQFPNGRIASAVSHSGSYGGAQGLWEVLDITGNRFDRGVSGWLTVADVLAEFDRIANT